MLGVGLWVRGVKLVHGFLWASGLGWSNGPVQVPRPQHLAKSLSKFPPLGLHLPRVTRSSFRRCRARTPTRLTPWTPLVGWSTMGVGGAAGTPPSVGTRTLAKNS